MEPVAEIQLKRHVRIYVEPSLYEKASVYAERMDEPAFFSPDVLKTHVQSPQKKIEAQDKVECVISRVIISKLEDGRFDIYGHDKRSQKLLPLAGSTKSYPPLHEIDIQRISTAVRSVLDAKGVGQILEYWDLLDRQDIHELNLILMLKKMRLLPPLPSYVRKMKGPAKAMAFYLNTFKYFHELKDPQPEFVPSDPGRTCMILPLQVPTTATSFNLLRISYRSNDFEKLTILRMLDDQERVKTVFKQLNHFGIFSTYHFVKFAHALFPDILSGIPLRNHTQSPEIRHIRHLVLGAKKNNKLEISPPKYILAKFFNADIRLDEEFEDEDLESLLEGLLPELVYPRDKDFPLRYKLIAPRWAGEIVPLNSSIKIDEEGDFQQNCLRTIERYRSGSYYGHLALFSIRKKGLRITVEVGQEGKIIQCFGYKNTFVDPEELSLQAVTEPGFVAPEPIYADDSHRNPALMETASKVRNRNEFLDTYGEIMHRDPADVRKFIDTCMQYFFTLEEVKLKSFIHRRKSVSQKHTLEVRTDYIKIRLTRSPRKTQPSGETPIRTWNLDENI